jgi:aquaporin Z
MRYVYELIGTFFLVLTVGMTALNSSTVGMWGPVAIGSVLAVMVFAGAHISGGHYNPAVSFTLFLRKNLSFQNLLLYWLAQLAAGVLAACVIIYFMNGAAPATHAEISLFKVFIAEFLFTFALCFVVLNVACVQATAGNSYFGWAIGFTVVAGAYTVGTVSSAAFNPAVALGITLLNLSQWSNLWVYILSSLLGAGAAAGVFNLAHPVNQKTREKLKKSPSAVN